VLWRSALFFFLRPVLPDPAAVATRQTRDLSPDGEVAWFSAEKGYGFIKPDSGGDDVFVHASNVDELGYGEEMSEGEPLEYDVERTDEGLSALNVTRLAP